ncbi:MAG: L-serine ammonia-lyase [Puniceicoccaceae bacterium]
MRLSVLDLYTIGIGPSSSHTVGPMRAAAQFAANVAGQSPNRIKVELFGSLAMTGRGHGTHLAIVAGLSGELPESVDPKQLPKIWKTIEASYALPLAGKSPFTFNPETDLVFNRRKVLPFHPNGMQFTAVDERGKELAVETLYSVGGGFVVRESDPPAEVRPCAFPFTTGEELLEWTEKCPLPVSGIVRENEAAWRPADETCQRLDAIWSAMQGCVDAGLHADGSLPGGLKVPRRAPGLYQKLCERPESALRDSLTILDWVDVYAIAVNEENACGGRVVTAPTNGAAGIIPAVMHYCDRFLSAPTKDWHRDFLLTAGAIGLLFKENASISGADVGCQGEVGVACSMAAGALAEFMGGSPLQVENAAEIGMEHNLGLTCDPVGGLVQIPCIERNAMGAVKAINAARIAVRGDGQHSVSLDAVIRTMRETGKDMRRKYKETSRGGLAVNVVEC